MKTKLILISFLLSLGLIIPFVYATECQVTADCPFITTLPPESRACNGSYSCEFGKYYDCVNNSCILMTNYYNCQACDSCSNGFCTANATIPTNATTCTDSDSGKDHLIYGKVQDANSTAYDSCIDEQGVHYGSGNYPYLEEQYCENGIRKSEVYTCLNGCEQGVCVFEKPIIDITPNIETVYASFVKHSVNAPAKTKNYYKGDISLKISGVGQAAGEAYSDAFYVYGNSKGEEVTSELIEPFYICLNGKPLKDYMGEIPKYNSNHEYDVSFHLDNAIKLGFSNCDLYQIDNSGEYKVEVKKGEIYTPTCECTKEYKPVCGSDGITYGNNCQANCAGVTLAYDGECKKTCTCLTEVYYPVCGSDGITYGSNCEANCAGVTVAYNGECKKNIERCVSYSRNNTKIEVCATCGDGICNAYENCVSSSMGCDDNNSCWGTSDCGGLYCSDDCVERHTNPNYPVPGSGCTNGCLYSNVCINQGTRAEGQYCEIGGTLVDQKEEGANCQNNYECKTIFCSNDVCYNLSGELKETKGLLNKILDALKGILGFSS